MAMRPMPEILFDCCVVSNFALAGALDVLESLYSGRAAITEFVVAEIRRGIQAGHAELLDIRAAVQAGWLRDVSLGSSEEKRIFESLSVSLGLGEASSIAIAALRGWRFASDDKAARREAGALGIPLTGTLGILHRALECGLRDHESANKALKKMVERGFYSPVRSLSGPKQTSRENLKDLKGKRNSREPRP